MTIQQLHAYAGRSPGIYNLGATEEARLIGLGLARDYTAGMDGQNPVFSTAEQLAVRGVVSEAGNITAAELATTTGTLGQTVRLSDGDNKGAVLMWSTPAGSSTPAWCWWLWPQSPYEA